MLCDVVGRLFQGVYKKGAVHHGLFFAGASRSMGLMPTDAAVETTNRLSLTIYVFYTSLTSLVIYRDRVQNSARGYSGITQKSKL